MWPFKKKTPGQTKPPRYVHKSQSLPKLPCTSKGRRQLYKVLSSLLKSNSFYADKIEQVVVAKEIKDNKDHQKFLIDYLREQRKMLDAVEACLMLSLSDAGHLPLDKPLRAYTEKVLASYLRQGQ